MKQQEGNGMGIVRRKSGIGRSLGAFALGAAAGSAIALLFAPASGQVTRRRIGLRLRRISREAGRRVGRVQRVLTRKAETLREATAEKINGARAWVAGHVANGEQQRRPRHRALRHA
jgi:gas vesicle protein